MAMSFVAKYPNRVEIIPELIEIGIEELEHFQEVYQLMEKRGVQLPDRMGQDPYVTALVSHCRTGRDERFLDRLVIASIVETRGAERFKLIAEGLEDRELGDFYKHFWTSEAKHGHVFVKMARHYFDWDEIQKRLVFFAEKEGEILQSLPIPPYVANLYTNNTNGRIYRDKLARV